MGFKIPAGHGTVILEIAKHIQNREVISSAVMQNGQGSTVHIWELSDGETLVLDQKPRQSSSHVPSEDIPATELSSWRDWQSTNDPINDVVKTKSAQGFSVKHIKSPNVPRNTQLQLAVSGA